MHTEEATVHSNGIDIAYDTFGDASCPPMVLIMGLSAQMVIWEDEFCTRLAKKGYRVIRFDNRDVGRSTKFDDLGLPEFPSLNIKDLGLPDFSTLMRSGTAVLPYSLYDMAQDVLGFLDALEIESAHFAGVSMGGMIAQILGMHYPDRVRTLAIIMSSTGNPLLPPPTPEALQYLFRAFPMQKDRYIEHFVDMWKVLNGKELHMDEKRLRKLGEITYERGVSPAGSARQLAAITASGSRKEGLGSIKAPTVVIHGEDDPLLPLPCGVDIAESIPGAKLKVIPGMGHALPPAVWDEIIAYITENAQSIVGQACR